MIDPFYTHGVKSSGAVSSDINAFMGWLTKDAGEDLVAGTKTVATLVAADVVAGLLCQGTSVRVIINGVAQSTVTYSDTGYNAGRYKWYQFEPVFDRSVESSIDEAAGRTVVTGIKAAFVQIDSQVNWRFTTEPEYYSIDWPLDTVSAFWLDGYGSFAPGDSDRESFQHYRNEKQFWTGLVNCTVFSDYSGYDPDALSLFSRYATDAPVSYKDAANTLIVDLKQAGYWNRLDSLYIPIRAFSEQAGCLDWRRPVSATIHGAASWSAEFGFVGSSPSSYINSYYDPVTDATNFALNGGSVGAYVTAVGTSALSYLFGCTDMTSYGLYLYENSIYEGRYGAGSNVYTGSGNVSPGLVVLQRNESNAVRIYKNGVAIATGGTTTKAVSIPSRNMYICGRNSNNTSSLGSTSKIGAWWAGAVFTPAEQANIKTLLDAYIATLS